tara:strand:+ start:281 stop:490 length:210 start_codon:yes stop_codon:yes gene_type:complete
MIIETILGVVISAVVGGDTNSDPATMIYKGLMTGNKIIQKEKNKEIDDSIHEETHQLAKDAILKMGGNK